MYVVSLITHVWLRMFCHCSWVKLVSHSKFYFLQPLIAGGSCWPINILLSTRTSDYMS